MPSKRRPGSGRAGIRRSARSAQPGGDLAHRIYIPQMLEPTPPGHEDSADSAGTSAAGPTAAGPAAPDAFPPEVRAHFAVPVATLHKIGTEPAVVQDGLDLAVIDEEQRKLVQNPAAAQAPLVARAQAEALAPQPAVAQQVGFDGPLVRSLYDKHDSLRNGTTCTTALISAVGHTRLVVQADRAMARALVKQHIKGRVAALPQTDPAHGHYLAAQSHIQTAEDRQEAKTQQRKDGGKEAETEALGRAQTAEAELKLAEVLFRLRQGIIPDHDTLLAAALELQRMEEDRRGADR